MKTLYYNGDIYTMKKPYDTVKNVLTEDGFIIGIDVEEKAEYHKFDLQGKTMLPALTDVHMHLIMLGKKLNSLVLYDDTDIEDVREKISGHSTDEEWDIILGYDENNFPDRYKMKKEELDQLTNQPTLIMRVCQHAGLVNSQALEELGVDENVEDPQGGYFERDEDGKLTGWTYDAAFEQVRSAQAAYENEGSISDDIATAVKYLQSLGIANAHTEDMSYHGPFTVPLNAYLNTLGPGKLKFRVNLLRHEQVYEDMVQKEIMYKPDWVEKDAMKIFIDGAFGAKTALLNEPYVGKNDSGLQIHSREELEGLVQKARRHDDAIAVHVIGDKAMGLVLDTLEKYPVTEEKHDRLIHVSLLNEQLIERMTKLNVICDIQPLFLTSDMPWVAEDLGEERSKRLYMFKTLYDKGLCLGGSADAPIEEVNPLLGVHALVTRRGKTGVYNQEEIIDRHSAFEMYTKNGAEIVYRTDKAGMIEDGYFADFAVFDTNVMTAEADELLTANVEYTIIDGEVVYENSH